MAITVHRLDFSGLDEVGRAATDVARGNLQRENQKTANVAGLIQGGIQLAGTVAQVIKEADLEKNKQSVANGQAQLRDKAREAIANNDFVQETGPDGKVTIKLGPSYQDTLNKLKDELPKSAFLGSTKRWISNSLDDANNAATSEALDVAYTQFSKQRDLAAAANVNEAIKTTSGLMASGYLVNELSNDEPDAAGLTKAQRTDSGITTAFKHIDEVIDSQTWRTDQDRALTKKLAHHDAGVQFSSLVAKEKVKSGGLAAATGWLDKETGWTEQDRATILSAAGAENDAQVQAAQSAVNVVFDGAIKNGQSPVAFRAETLAKIPTPFLGAAQAQYDKRQLPWAHDQTMKELSQVNDLPGLLNLIDKIQGNTDGRYYGEKGAKTWDQQQDDLREAKSQIAFMGGGSKSEAEKAAQDHIRTAYENYVQGHYDFDQAKKIINDWGAQAGGDYQTTFMGRLRKDVPEPLKPIFDNMPKTTEEGYRQAKGYKRDRLLSPDDQSDLDSLTAYKMGLAMDIVHEAKAGTPMAEILKRANQATAIYYAKEYDILRKPPTADGGFFGLGGSTENEALAKFLKVLNSDNLGDMVYQDENGTPQWAPGYEKSVLKARDMLQARAETALGKSLSPVQEREGLHDIAPTFYFVDPSTKTRYRYDPTSNGKDIILMEQKKGEAWKSAALPAAASEPATPPAPKPAAPLPRPTPPKAQPSPATWRKSQVEHYLPEIAAMSTDTARRARMAELVGAGAAGWNDFLAAGYNRDGSKVGSKKK